MTQADRAAGKKRKVRAKPMRVMVNLETGHVLCNWMHIYPIKALRGIGYVRATLTLDAPKGRKG
jgi:hypothetical protein